MATKIIMLACAGGMSSSLLAKHMQDAAAADGIDAKVFAVPAELIGDDFAKYHPDVIMIGPQVRFVAPQWQKKLNIPVAVIDMLDYGRMRGEKVLQTAMQLLAAQK